MITRDDHVKILDFGLAKPIARPRRRRNARRQRATNAGTVLGTFGYMAPEQVRGLAIDHRADIFAFGAVLYEMLSGERAFQGETAADTMTAILTKDPPDLDLERLAISPALDRIVRRCLEKRPNCASSPPTISRSRSKTLATASGVGRRKAWNCPRPESAAGRLAAVGDCRDAHSSPRGIRPLKPGAARRAGMAAVHAS